MPFAAPFPDPQLQLPNYEKKLFHNYQNKENILAEFKSFYNNIKLSNDQQALGLCKAVFEHFGDAEAASKIQLSDNSDYNFYKIYLSILSLNPPNLTYKGAIEIT
ncbi:MAG: hypothetical protein N3G80_03810, partial [Candidatus Micrarchaeota archaeon]|nr:hypothetical protein [Candidatus Micrarchaeota archaeon]